MADGTPWEQYLEEEREKNRQRWKEEFKRREEAEDERRAKETGLSVEECRMRRSEFQEQERLAEMQKNKELLEKKAEERKLQEELKRQEDLKRQEQSKRDSWLFAVGAALLIVIFVLVMAVT